MSLSVGSASVFVTVMVVGAAPHENVTMPPAVNAAASKASVHDAAVPVPTTVVGLLVSASVMGAAQIGGGGVTPEASTSAGRPPSAPVPVSSPDAPSARPPPAVVSPPGATGASLDEHAATTKTAASGASTVVVRRVITEA